jgi:hypothetical protein
LAGVLSEIDLTLRRADNVATFQAFVASAVEVFLTHDDTLSW